MTYTRADGRAADQLRPVTITRKWLDHAEGSTMVEFGNTRVLVPLGGGARAAARFGSGGGWVTAEYGMLPRATHSRSQREAAKGKRAAAPWRSSGSSAARCAPPSISPLGVRTFMLDCDVIQADGGTRTAAITGAYVALARALRQAEGKGTIAPSRCCGRWPPSPWASSTAGDGRSGLRGGLHGGGGPEPGGHGGGQTGGGAGHRRGARSTARCWTPCSTSESRAPLN